MSEHDDLDRRLGAAGEAWRAAQLTTVPPVPEDLGRHRWSSRRWAAPLAVAASVALLSGGVALVADRVGDTAGEQGAAGRAGAEGAEGEVGDRWHPDLPPGLEPADVPGAVAPVPQEVVSPRAEVAGEFTPSLTETVGKPACSADDITLGLSRGDADGEVDLRVETDAGPCVLSRYPFLEFERDGRPTEVLTISPDPGPGDWPVSVLVTPDRAALLRTSWTGWCGAPPFDKILMYLDDNSLERLEVAGAVTACTITGGLPERMALDGWQPEGWRLDPPADFSNLRAALVRTVEGPRDLPTWVVELTSPRDLDLDTCPSWEVRQGDEESASWRLSCDGVRTRLPDGSPYLPMNTPVRFAVWVPYGDSDAALTWVLRTPDGEVSVPLSAGPEAPDGEPRLVAEQDANLHLWLSNQSFDDEEVRLAVEIDGVPLVDDDFAVEGQHNYVAFPIAVAPGEHTVVVTSDSGARVERVVRVPERGDRWAAALYWAGEDGTPSLDWMFRDEPIGWA